MNFDSILEYWFGELMGPLDFPTEKSALWFRKSDATDNEIRDRFQFMWQKAGDGAYDSWAKDPRGRLALIILNDQFSRNMYREDARAFSRDFQALELATNGVAARMDRNLFPIERVFFYLPFEHAEDLPNQNMSCTLFTELLESVPDQMKSAMKEFLRYADAHREIIKKFGRFPHRNEILKRKSTPEEVEFLKTNKGF
ncbi:MAG: DUF924 family protein [Bdellovibrionia bacterium]